ncbi:unnamed protein product [Protopolystoma xenopodis]|uniref:Uncharacterized protein n=1 Tax=Protopolystoma xenopodis TaxID=117903 RepID=A0A3S5FEI1_9PLAT|nr:unnamed protein product [Protopolystoma xenopodis]
MSALLSACLLVCRSVREPGNGLGSGTFCRRWRYKDRQSMSAGLGTRLVCPDSNAAPAKSGQGKVWTKQLSLSHPGNYLMAARQSMSGFFLSPALNITLTTLSPSSPKLCIREISQL